MSVVCFVDVKTLPRQAFRSLWWVLDDTITRIKMQEDGWVLREEEVCCDAPSENSVVDEEETDTPL